MHSQHGDPLQQSILYPLLYNCTIPIRDMIVEWICNGIINDPYQEFFVSTDKMIGEEKLWYDKYTLRVPMIPTFLTMEQAKKIWITGKSINFLRVVCKDRTMLQIIKTPASCKLKFSVYNKSGVCQLPGRIFSMLSKFIFFQLKVYFNNNVQRNFKI
jgi:hypothetical protein